jgi:hypothetical protein
MSFEESLSLKSSKIAVQGTAVGQGSKQNVDIVGSQVLAALREDSQHLSFRHEEIPTLNTFGIVPYAIR